MSILTLFEVESSHSSLEEVQELMAAISRMNKLPPSPPLLKLYTIDTGQRKLTSASISPSGAYISCGFHDSTVALWDTKQQHEQQQPLLESTDWADATTTTSSLDLACSIGQYHEPLKSLSVAAESVNECEQGSAVVCRGHSAPVYSTQFTPSSDHLLTASDDTTLRLYTSVFLIFLLSVLLFFYSI